MSLLVKVLVCHLLCLHGILISCQQPAQQNNRIQTFLSDIRRFLHIPTPNRSMKQNQYTEPQKATNIPRFNSQQKTWSAQENNIKNNDNTKLNPDCSDQISLSCDEQRKLLNDIFRNNKPRINSNIKVSSRHGTYGYDGSIIFQDMGEESPDDFETTTDYGLDDRIAPPEVVASLLG